MIVDQGYARLRIVLFSMNDAVALLRDAVQDGDEILVDAPCEGVAGFDLSTLAAVVRLTPEVGALCTAQNGAHIMSSTTETMALVTEDADAFVFDLPPPAEPSSIGTFAKHVRRHQTRLAAARVAECPLVVRATPSDALALSRWFDNGSGDVAALAAPLFVDPTTSVRDTLRRAAEEVVRLAPAQRPGRRKKTRG